MRAKTAWKKRGRRMKVFTLQTVCLQQHLGNPENRTQVSTCSSASSAPSARLKMEMERAALLAQAAGIKQKYALEEKDDNPKAEKEELEINTTLAAAAVNSRFCRSMRDPTLHQVMVHILNSMTIRGRVRESPPHTLQANMRTRANMFQCHL